MIKVKLNIRWNSLDGESGKHEYLKYPNDLICRRIPQVIDFAFTARSNDDVYKYTIRKDPSETVSKSDIDHIDMGLDSFFSDESDERYVENAVTVYHWRYQEHDKP